MRILSFCLILLVSLYYMNCNHVSTTEDTSLNNMLFGNDVIDIPFDPGKVVLINGADPGNFSSDGFIVDEINIDGDSLKLQLSYGGGCKEHTFFLFAYNYFMESYPVQASLFLSHDSANDPCDAWVTNNISIDLSPLREEYKKLYSAGSSEIILNIYTDKELTEKSRVSYKF